MDIPKRREILMMLPRAAAASSFATGLLMAQQPAAPNPVRQEWLDRHKEPVLEPDLPISIRTTIFGFEEIGGTSRRVAGRYRQRPQYSGYRIRASALHVPRQRAGGNAARGRDRVRKRRSRHVRERILRKNPRCGRDRGPCRSDAGAPGRARSQRVDARRWGPLSRHPPYHRLGRRYVAQ